MAPSERLTAAPARRHRLIADDFTRRVHRHAGLVGGGTGLGLDGPRRGRASRRVASSCVAGGCDVRLPAGPPPTEQPAAAWVFHRQAVQDAPGRSGDRRRGVHQPPHRLDAAREAIDRFYTSDVFLHTWDLARATGQDETLDPEVCANMLAGMEPLDELLRNSGQYGPAVTVPDDADVQTRLIGFIGRDPAWAAASVR